MSVELFAGKDGICALDTEADSAAEAADTGVAVWVATKYGEAFRIDAREPGRTTHRFSPHEKKVSSLSCIRGTPYFATASTDAVVAVWDARRLPAASARVAKPLVALQHGLTATSAFFSARGRRLVSTCNDDRIRVWDVDVAAAAKSGAPLSPEPTAAFSHDNHTGRWLTSFKTVFDPANDATLIVGAMQTHYVRTGAIIGAVPSHTLHVHAHMHAPSPSYLQVQLFDASAGGTLLGVLSSELLNAVPTLNAAHPDPSVAAIVSATASGRLFLWT